MKIFLYNSDNGPDYLADLINYYFISNRYQIFTNYRLDFLFDDFKNKDYCMAKALRFMVI